MNEQNMGMEPEVRLFFKKIMKTVSMVLIWVMAMATTGLFMKWAYIVDGIRWQNIVFYAGFFFTFTMLVRSLFRLWAKQV